MNDRRTRLAGQGVYLCDERICALSDGLCQRHGRYRSARATLGNTVPHLHTHVVPRYRDDPAPGGPIAWEEIFSSDPAPEAELRRQAAGLRLLLAH